MKNSLFFITALLLLIAAGGMYLANRLTIKPSPVQAGLDFLTLPPGFQISVFAEGLGGSPVSIPGPNPGPRMMALRGDEIFVTVPRRGTVYVLADTDNDGRADLRKTFITNLSRPHGIALYEDWVYIAEEERVIRVKDRDNNGEADPGTQEVLIALPGGGFHVTRTIKIINDKLYIAVGSTCNACLEKDQTRATLQWCDLNGRNCSLFATGLRNTVDFVEHGGKIYGTDNGRDLLGNDLPPDEVNIIAAGKDYGWPFCYGPNIPDQAFAELKENACVGKTPPFLELPAHSAPLGLAFYEGQDFPPEYRGRLFIAYHGSWNRQPPTGYKIVVADPATGQISDFATGWFDGATVKGRPVGIMNYKGGLLVTDDNQGKIYFISYRSR